jgi:hypothetical protein
MTLLEMAQNSRGFKAYSKRTINGRSLSHPQRLAIANKAFKAKFKAFCKRRGPLSILKENEYSTGAGTTAEPVMARISFKAGEFTSEILNPTESVEISRDAAESEAA